MDDHLFLQQLRALDLDEAPIYLQRYAVQRTDYTAIAHEIADEAFRQRDIDPFICLKLAELLIFFGEHVLHPSFHALGLKLKGDALHFVGHHQAALEALDEAGNDSNTPDMPERMVPRYPAAYPEVISVGAVDSTGEAVPYSDYPALLPDHNGVVTYGGALAEPKPSSPEPDVEPKIDPKSLDAPRGIYSAPTYPSLSADAPMKEYEAANPAAWAYWSGTSFSTPIISAVAARLLELHADSLPTHLRAGQIQWAITTARGQQEMLTGDHPLPVQPLFSAGILKAVQEPKK